MWSQATTVTPKPSLPNCPPARRAQEAKGRLLEHSRPADTAHAAMLRQDTDSVAGPDWAAELEAKLEDLEEEAADLRQEVQRLQQEVNKRAEVVAGLMHASLCRVVCK